LNFSLPKTPVAQKQQHTEINPFVKGNKEKSGIEILLSLLIINSIDEVRSTQSSLGILWRKRQLAPPKYR
jgi:hypothetical protein